VLTVAVDIEVDNMMGAELIPLESITCSPSRSKSLQLSTQSMESLEASPLLFSSEPHTSTNKQKGKPQRRRASTKPIIDTLKNVSGIAMWECRKEADE